MTGRPEGSASVLSRHRRSVHRYSESGLAHARQSTPPCPEIDGSGVSGSSDFGRTSPSNGQVSHSCTGGVRSAAAARAWSCSGVSGMRRGYGWRVEWPDEFYAWRAGDGCPTCAEGRPEATRGGVRYFAGASCDAYLVRADIQRGLSIAVFRGRHVAEPTELSDAEAATYGAEVLHVGRAIEAAFGPVKLN